MDFITESFNTPSFWKQYEDYMISTINKSNDPELIGRNIKKVYKPGFYSKEKFIKLVDAELLRIKRNNKHLVQ